MKCLYQLHWSDLCSLVEEQLLLQDWIIFNDTIRGRLRSVLAMQSVSMETRCRAVTEQAEKNGIRYNETEIVTWFDTLKLMHSVFGCLSDPALRDRIVIVQEYCIPYSEKRADYVLCCDNKLLILEFSFRKIDDSLQYENKLHQAIGYKELIGNILPKEIDIGTYTFLVEAGNANNERGICDLARYIEKFFDKSRGLAFGALLRLED